MPKTIKRQTEPKTLPAAPIEYAGQWVAWDEQRKSIVAHGEQMADVHRAAVAAGHKHCIMQKVPRANTIFIGPAGAR